MLDSLLEAARRHGAGVIPVQWNQSALSRMRFRLKSARPASAIIDELVAALAGALLPEAKKGSGEARIVVPQAVRRFRFPVRNPPMFPYRAAIKENAVRERDVT